ncbi:MAG: hypothetical protein UHC59_08195 [Fibrobacteraceae bacterium]|nr:hypothetical protein [Fibrobacteraceae bacterium]
MENAEYKNEKDVTELVNNCFLRIEDIEKKIADSELSAKSAKESANKAMSVERHFFQNTTAKIVDQLQPAVKDLANAIEVSAETQKLLFEHQRILAECCRSLFGMGVSNITMIRCTINTIKMKLENASDEEISEMAKQELLNVVRQLKMQEDLFSKQEKIGTKVKGMDDKLKGMDSSLLNHKKDIETIHKRNKEHDERLNRYEQKMALNDKRLSKQNAKDIEQDKRLKDMGVKNAEHEKKLNVLSNFVGKLYQRLNIQNSSIVIPKELECDESKLPCRVEKLEKMIRWVALSTCISVMSLVIAILSLLLF